MLVGLTEPGDDRPRRCGRRGCVVAVRRAGLAPGRRGRAATAACRSRRAQGDGRRAGDARRRARAASQGERARPDARAPIAGILRAARPTDRSGAAAVAALDCAGTMAGRHRQPPPLARRDPRAALPDLRLLADPADREAYRNDETAYLQAGLPRRRRPARRRRPRSPTLVRLAAEHRGPDRAARRGLGAERRRRRDRGRR